MGIGEVRVSLRVRGTELQSTVHMLKTKATSEDNVLDLAKSQISFCLKKSEILSLRRMSKVRWESHKINWTHMFR